jgi:uncharacterized membrane protein
MEEYFKSIASYFALMLEVIVVVTVTLGSFEALYRIVLHGLIKNASNWGRRAIWVRYASWILLSLEFALGADIIRTAIAPTWDDIGKLGAIAVIRTFLNYFVAKDLESVEERKPAADGAL